MLNPDKQSSTAGNRPVRYEIRREAATRSELHALGWSESDMHERAWPRIVHAYAIDPAGLERLVRHHRRHSPTGFEYGYQGSGPAELARCLLIDLYDLHELADSDVALGGRDPLPVSYQRFKRAFIACLDPAQPRHTILVSDIDAWAREQLPDQSTTTTPEHEGSQPSCPTSPPPNTSTSSPSNRAGTSQPSSAPPSMST